MSTTIPTFAEATAVTPTGSHTYAANLDTNWSIGSVAHGGVVTSILLRVAATHFRTTLAPQSQPHTLALHASFLRRTHPGPATISVRDLKLGRQTSTLHLALTQDGRPEEVIVAYVTQGDLLAPGTGPSYATGWSLQPPPPPPPADLARLGGRGAGAGAGAGAGDQDDPHWVRWTNLPFPTLRKAVNRVEVYLPRAGPPQPALVDEWLRLQGGERFTDAAMGFVADIWPQMIERLDVEAQQQQRGTKGGNGGGGGAKKPWLWFPTLVLNLDIKKALPPGGAEWLFVRVQAKRIQNGRFDYEVVIMDEGGDVVALSHHVAMVMDGSRNTAKRRTAGSKI
ncbi:thioesterase-like superfamily-domain-containing protein [Xylariaceae sp. FL0016]|nr:thioesterase-like superfamily-domain-containing protein [Xylariaceae sp. FL0016]